MAAIKCEVPIPQTALVAGTPKTLVQLAAPTNQRVKVLAIGLYTDGVTSNAIPVSLQILKQTTSGTGTAITVVTDEGELTETVQTVATGTYTVEPTYGAIYRNLKEPAFMGVYEVPVPQGEEIVIGGGARWAIVATAPAGVNISGYVRFEE